MFRMHNNGRDLADVTHRRSGGMLCSLRLSPVKSVTTVSQQCATNVNRIVAGLFAIHGDRRAGAG